MTERAELFQREKALEARVETLCAIFGLWAEASRPIEPDTEWAGQGWISNARKWIQLLACAREAKEFPGLIAEATDFARRCFHVLKALREDAMREDSNEYARFIDEAGTIADELRELID